ncbi:hypothetical protein ACTXT7_012191 [Hymenolepis weldensis]
MHLLKTATYPQPSYRCLLSDLRFHETKFADTRFTISSCILSVHFYVAEVLYFALSELCHSYLEMAWSISQFTQLVSELIQLPVSRNTKDFNYPS